ncbi:unnamed protein product [Effrenium voratum]|nr:unnamed protein product [Effrenium voratum]
MCELDFSWPSWRANNENNYDDADLPVTPTQSPSYEIVEIEDGDESMEEVVIEELEPPKPMKMIQRMFWRGDIGLKDLLACIGRTRDEDLHTALMPGIDIPVEELDLSSHRDRSRRFSTLDAKGTRLKEFDPQSIANMVFGMGLLGLQYEDRLLEEVGKQVPQRLIEFQLEEVISMFYSLGKLRYSPAEGKLLAAMGDYVIDRIDTLGPTRLLKVVEAANQVDFPKSRLMNVLMNQIAREINGFTVHQIVVLVRSCAQAEVKHAKGTTAITEEVMSRLSELNTDARLSQIMDNLKIMQDLVRKKKKKEEVELTQ